MRNQSLLIISIALLFAAWGSGAAGQEGPCSFSVSPTTIFFQLPGGAAEVNVKASNPGCTFSASTLFPWIRVSTNQERGEGKVLVAVDGNMSFTHRVGTVRVDGKEISIVQYGPRISGGG